MRTVEDYRPEAGETAHLAVGAWAVGRTLH
jgi:hypothetical protein